MALEEIFNGFSNNVKSRLNILKEELSEMGKTRMAICNGCALKSGNMCSSEIKEKHVETGELTPGCGCFLPAKTLSKQSNCPLGKWPKIK
jgi:hypothetical protein